MKLHVPCRRPWAGSGKGRCLPGTAQLPRSATQPAAGGGRGAWGVTKQRAAIFRKGQTDRTPAGQPRCAAAEPITLTGCLQAPCPTQGRAVAGYCVSYMKLPQISHALEHSRIVQCYNAVTMICKTDQLMQSVQCMQSPSPCQHWGVPYEWGVPS